MRLSRFGTLAALVTAAALTLSACGGDDGGGTSASGSPKGGGSVTIGAFNFGESQLLANMYAGALRKAGFEVQVRALGAREVVEPALEKGSKGGGVDVVPEYLATFTEFLNKKANGPDAAAKASGDVAATLAAGRELAAAVGIELLEPSKAADQNAFAVTKEFAAANGVTSLSDLATKYSGPLALGGPPECPTRPFCQPGLEKTYGLKFSGFSSLDAGGPLTKKALQQGKVQLGLVFSSDGGLEAFGLQVLTDDKALQNADNVVAAVTKSAKTDALTTALDAVSAALTTEQLVALNKKVDIDGEDPAAVAAAWLKDKGLA